MQSKIIMFLNAYTQGISGGDIRCIEIAKRIFPSSMCVVTSNLGERLCRENGLEAEFCLTTEEKRFGSLISTYIKRTLVAIKILKRSKVQDAILYSTSDFFPDVIPAFLLRLFGKENKWVQVIHHIIPNPFLRRGNFLRNFIAFITQRISFLFIRFKADKIVAIGPELAEVLKDKGFKESRVSVGYNGVDIKKIVNKSIDNETKGYNAIFVGRLHPNKGIEDLIDVWNMFAKEGKSYTLGVIGKGEQLFIESIKSKIKDYGIEDKVSLLGYVGDIYSYMKKADVFTFPSYEEGWGISICEALICESPVIVYDLPVYRKIYDEALTYVETGDKESFKDCISKCIVDKDYSKIMIEKGLKVCGRYDLDEVAKRENKIIEG